MPEKLTAAEAREILEGIVALACRIAKADPKEFRVKQGGGPHKKKGVTIDIYSSVQNVDANINSPAAKDGGLIRRSFMILQFTDNAPAELKIVEWDAKKDWEGQYREIWSKPYNAPKAKQEMASLMAKSISELWAGGGR